MTYHITFKHGLQNPIDVEANTPEEAKKIAFAHHLKNSGFAETVEYRLKIDDVVGEIQLVSNPTEV